jgi:hypothetical protein
MGGRDEARRARPMKIPWYRLSPPYTRALHCLRLPCRVADVPSGRESMISDAYVPSLVSLHGVGVVVSGSWEALS